MKTVLASLLMCNLQKRALELDISKGDTLLGGRFKNIPMVVDEIGTDELGQPTVNGRKLLAYRIQKKLPKTAGDERPSCNNPEPPFQQLRRKLQSKLIAPKAARTP